MKPNLIRSSLKNHESNFRSLPKLRRYVAAFSLAVAIACSFGLARSTSAVPLLFTLTGVTFNDGATASGSFIFDPDTEMFGAFNIATTDSLSYMGATYSSSNASIAGFPDSGGSPDVFTFDNNIDHYLQFLYSGHITAPGIYALQPGSDSGQGYPVDAFEYVDNSNYRIMTGGFFTVTGLASVPETGGTSLSLTIGLMAIAGFKLSLRCRAVRAPSSD